MIIIASTGKVHEAVGNLTRCGTTLKKSPMIATVDNLKLCKESQFCRKCFQNGSTDALQLLRGIKNV